VPVRDVDLQAAKRHDHPVWVCGPEIFLRHGKVIERMSRPGLAHHQEWSEVSRSLDAEFPPE